MRIQVELEGNSPLMMHNERLSNKDDEFAKRIAELTDKKTNQTERDKAEISKLEWFGGLYRNGGDEIVVPSANIIRCFRESAAVTKKGKDVARALTPIALHSALVHSGPKKLDEMFANPVFVDKRQVKIGRGRITRTRPVFPKWALVAEFELLDTVMNLSEFERIVELAGTSTGLCDGRILGYGRFSAKVRKV